MYDRRAWRRTSAGARLRARSRRRPRRRRRRRCWRPARGSAIAFASWRRSARAGWAWSTARDVAIKVHARESGAARLEREATAMAQLSHPNVVAIYEVGTHEGALFIAMELVAGVTARAWRERGKRSWRDVVRLYLAAGEGLAAVHRAGLIHRDFKPENVLVGADGRVRVADLGLARAVGTPR